MSSTTLLPKLIALGLLFVIIKNKINNALFLLFFNILDLGDT